MEYILKGLKCFNLAHHYIQVVYTPQLSQGPETTTSIARKFLENQYSEPIYCNISF